MAHHLHLMRLSGRFGGSRTRTATSRQVLCHLVSSLAMRVLEPIPGSVLSRFDDILLQDGSSLAVHDALAHRFPGRFTAVSPAAVELHVTMSLFEDRPL